MTTEIDSLTIKDLESRYGVARSNIYHRIDGLKKLGYPLEPEKQGTRSIFNADHIALMDSLDAHLREGGAIATFPAAKVVLPVLQNTSDLSYETQDTSTPIETSSAALGMMSFADAIVTKLIESYPQPQYEPDPLANLRTIQEACDRGWLLSLSQLAPLVGRESLPSKPFERFGFQFINVGRTPQKLPGKSQNQNQRASFEHLVIKASV